MRSGIIVHVPFVYFPGKHQTNNCVGLKKKTPDIVVHFGNDPDASGWSVVRRYFY